MSRVLIVSRDAFCPLTLNIVVYDEIEIIFVYSSFCSDEISK